MALSGLGCQSFAAQQWLSTRPAPSSALAGPVAVEARAAGESRGLGLFAVRDIPQFSQILVDIPLVTMSPGEDLPELYLHFQRLRKPDQELFLALSQREDPARDALLKDKLLQRGFGKTDLEQMANVANIMQTNAFNVDFGDGLGSNHRALFPKVARLNHSCCPNAHVCFSPLRDSHTNGVMVVHALKHIHPGDEVLISYFNIVLPRVERQAKAQKWGFKCDCRACAGVQGTEDLRASVRAVTARQTSLTQRERVTLRDINALIREAEALIVQIKDGPELLPTLPELFDGIGMLQAKALAVQKREDDRQALLVAFEQSVLWDARITGRDSSATIKRLKKLRAFGEGHSVPSVVRENDDFVVEWAPK